MIGNQPAATPANKIEKDAMAQLRKDPSASISLGVEGETKYDDVRKTIKDLIATSIVKQQDYDSILSIDPEFKNAKLIKTVLEKCEHCDELKTHFSGDINNLNCTQCDYIETPKIINANIALFIRFLYEQQSVVQKSVEAKEQHLKLANDLTAAFENTVSDLSSGCI